MDEKLYGHKKMIVWQMADKLDGLIQNVLGKIPRTEFKLREQLDSATDSVGSNFVEGYYSNSLNEYIRFLRYSKRSLGEVQQRMRRILRKKYISEGEYKEVDSNAGRTMYLFDRLIDSLERKRANTEMAKKANRADRANRATGEKG
ncbi:MAG: four helix bundle protein [Candidatus Margulisiibacteriota bacterium]